MSRTVDRPSQPYSRDRAAKIAHWFHSDPPWAIRPRSGLTAIKDRIARLVRLTWRWRDISPGPVLFVVLWLWARIPLPGPSVPELPVGWLLGLCGALSVASLWFDSSHDRTANKDRAAHQFKRRFQKAWLDLGVDAPIPGIGRPRVRSHATTARVEIVEGTNEWDMGRKVRQRLGNIYRAPADLISDSEGGALLIIRHSDPLTADPELPTFLGNHEGPEVEPSLHAVPFGIDRDADVFMLDLDQKHMLIGGITGSGKSSSANAMIVADIATRYVQPYALNPDEGSFDCFKGLIPYAGTPQACLAMLRDVYELVAKRTTIRAQLGTSLLPVSDEHPVIRLYVDEIQYLYDEHIHGKDFVTEFDGCFRDVLNRGRKVQVNVVALATDFSKDVLDKALVRQFKVRACFHVADSYAAQIVLGDGIPTGLEPQRIPDDKPGLCTLKTGGWRQVRTFRCWDAKARQAASVLLGVPAASCELPAPSAADRQNPHFKVDTDSVVDSLPITRRRGDARRLIVSDLQLHGPDTPARISERTSIPVRTVSYWLTDPACKRRIPVLAHGGGVYGLAGEAR